MTTLEQQYEDLCQTPSDIYLHLPTFVTLVAETKATHVIELGTRTGVSTVAWLYALEGRGRLTSVDIDARPPIGEHAHWSFIQGDDCDPALVSTLDVADIVFIDTSHGYRHTLMELNIYRHVVRPGGLIVCHDTELAHPMGEPHHPAFPVKSAIEEFTSVEGLAWRNNPECWGLGIIEVV